MSVPDLFTFLAIGCFLAASVVAFVQRSPVAGLFCAGVLCLVLSGAGFLVH